MSALATNEHVLDKSKTNPLKKFVYFTYSFAFAAVERSGTILNSLPVILHSVVPRSAARSSVTMG